MSQVNEQFRVRRRISRPVDDRDIRPKKTAFLVMPYDDIPDDELPPVDVYFDVDLAHEFAALIFGHPTGNKALLSFAHQLQAVEVPKHRRAETCRRISRPVDDRDIRPKKHAFLFGVDTNDDIPDDELPPVDVYLDVDFLDVLAATVFEREPTNTALWAFAHKGKAVVEASPKHRLG